MTFRMVKHSIAVIALAYFGIAFVVSVLIVYFNFIDSMIIVECVLLLLGLCAFAGTIHQCLIKRIVIGETGVEYFTLTKHYTMSWAEIKIIGIGYIPIKAPGRPPWVYFAADGIACAMLNAGSINDKYFMVHYRQAIVDEIKKYWSGEILGLDQVA